MPPAPTFTPSPAWQPKAVTSMMRVGEFVLPRAEGDAEDASLVIYFFGGISKLKGIDWWDGSALWMSLSNYEYQSLDMTWLIGYPAIIALLTHATVIWETFYCVLIWPRYSRGIMLSMAVLVHGGIGLAMGMPTFGLAMIIANIGDLSGRAAPGSRARWRSGRPRGHPCRPREWSRRGTPSTAARAIHAGRRGDRRRAGP